GKPDDVTVLLAAVTSTS
ncbi:unnamed protein product, partial [Rotaria magnacalcarata]